MWILKLNDMRSAQIENLTPVARADTKEELAKFLADNEVPDYKTDDKWAKVYKQGGPLEWFNKPYAFEHDLHLSEVIPIEEVLKRTREHYEQCLSDIPLLSEVTA